MYEEFTDSLTCVFKRAQWHAKRLNHEYIGTEHVLLGMIDDPNSVACNVLRSLVSLAAVQHLLSTVIQPGPEMVTVGKLPMTPRLKRAIGVARDKASFWKHRFVNTEHMLIGLAEQDGAAGECLAQLGVTSKAIESRTLDALSLESKAGGSVSLESKRLIGLLIHCGNSLESLVKDEKDELAAALKATREAIRWLSEHRARAFIDQ
jgi:ATP-dependent Clp protease ATP-binding subunit ClpC